MRGRAAQALGSGTRDRCGALPAGRVMNGPADGEVDYKKKYRNLKRKLKFLIYVSAGMRGGGAGAGAGAGRTPGRPRVRERGAGVRGRRAPGPFPMAPGSASTSPVIQEHECFQEELRKAQRKLLKVSRDKRWGAAGGGGRVRAAGLLGTGAWGGERTPRAGWEGQGRGTGCAGDERSCPPPLP